MTKGYWTGRGTSYQLRKEHLSELGIKRHWWNKTLFRYVESDSDPLTYHSPTLGHFRPLNGLVHDYGSIPRPLQIIPCFSKDRYGDSYVLHDSAYEQGHKVMFSEDGEKFKAICVTREFADALLRECVIAQGGLAPTATAIYSAVRVGGWLSW